MQQFPLKQRAFLNYISSRHITHVLLREIQTIRLIAASFSTYFQCHLYPHGATSEWEASLPDLWMGIQLESSHLIQKAIYSFSRHMYIQWGKKVFSQPPIVQVLPLKKMRGACNCHHRYTSTMRDKIRNKNPENRIVGFLKNLFANYGGK